jgi:hypothetical protein
MDPLLFCWMFVKNRKKFIAEPAFVAGDFETLSNSTYPPTRYGQKNDAETLENAIK